MKKYIVVASVFMGLALVFFYIGNHISAQEQTPPESVTHEGGSFGKVTWSHSGHTASVGCKECHHMAESPVQKCNSCHTADATLDAKAAYHKNCIDCHKAKEQGPTGCMDCHKK
ncbi:MAG TPA: cytochrome c3 family protein [Candidatus Omnitrophota bacterium]|nr:cytochrome c3 family protein [Candidatus Omnitrophota bacterium]